MLFHVASIPSPVDMVVRSADTDILVIALECLSTIDPHKKSMDGNWVGEKKLSMLY